MPELRGPFLYGNTTAAGADTRLPAFSCSGCGIISIGRSEPERTAHLASCPIKPSGDAGAPAPETEPCEHESASGVDQTPLEDAAKVWRCDGCGYLYRNVTEHGITRREPAGAPREATDAE